MTENKLICPICQTPLDYSFQTDKVCGCPKCRNIGNIDLWQELIHTKELLEIESAEHSMCHTQMLKTTEKLERTRKALDVAVDMLTRIAVSPETMMEPEKVVPQLADLALEQITAILENKNGNC